MVAFKEDYMVLDSSMHLHSKKINEHPVAQVGYVEKGSMIRHREKNISPLPRMII